MFPLRVDRSFQRFCRTGSTAALAAVFDHTAPELHHVARLLVRDAHAAEDLVQQTFLIAIETRQRYDRKRRVTPWLLGILVNLARQRRQRVQNAVAEAAAEPAAPGADDPVAGAAARELAEVVRAGVRNLPEPYRAVLSRHLQDGLGARAIAAERGARPATVRSQLARATEMLRRALPAGLAGAAVAALPSVSLAAVRVRVLAAGAAAAGSSAVVATGGAGSLVVQKTALAALAAVALTLVGWLSWSGGGSAATRALADADGPRAQAPELAAKAAAPGTAARREVAAAPAAAAGMLVVRARYASDDTAAANVGIWMRSAAGTAQGIDQHTDAEGVARFAELAAGSWLVLPDRCSGRRVEVEAAGAQELSLVIPRGVAVLGVVTDGVVQERKQRIAGARIYRTQREYPGFFRQVAVADADGRFHVRDLELPCELLARGDGYQPSEGRPLRGEPGTTVQLELELGAPGHRLLGEIMDAAGAPVPHALVVVGIDEDVRRSAHSGRPVAPRKRRMADLEEFVVRADVAGRFDAREVPAGEVLVVARAEGDGDTGVAAARTTVRADVENHVQLRLGHGAGIEGVVRDRTGAPVAALPVRVQWNGSTELGRWEEGAGNLAFARTAITDPAGRFAVGSLLPGEHQVSLGTQDDPPAADAVRERVELLPDQLLRREFVVERRVPLRLRVRGPDGSPLGGSTIRVTGAENGTTVAGSTDADGGAFFPRVPDEPLLVAVHASADGRTAELPMLVVRGLRGGDAEQELRVRDLPTAQLRGRAADGPAGVVLHHVEYAASRRLSLDARSREFVFADLPAGEYWLQLEGAPHGALGPWPLTAGQQLDVGELSMPPTRFALLRPPAAAASGFRKIEIFDGSRRSCGTCTQVADGFRSPALAPGRYLACVGGVAFGPAVEFELPADRDIDVALPQANLAVTKFVVDAPVPLGPRLEIELWLRAGGVEASLCRGPLGGRIVDGDARRLEFELPMTPGSYRIEVESRQHGHGVADFVLGDGAREAIQVHLR